MSASAHAYISARDYIPGGAWPADLLGAAGEAVLDNVAWEDGGFFGEYEAWWAWARLRVMAEAVFELPLVPGLALVVGDGPVDVYIEGAELDWKIRITAEVMRLRLPRSVFKPVVERDGKLVEDPDPTTFVQIQLPFTVSFTNTGDLEIEWPGEEEQPLVLPQSMILPGVVVGGDLAVVVKDGKFQAVRSTVTRYDADTGLGTPLSLVGLYADKRFFALQWKEKDLNAILKQLAPQLVDEGHPIESEVTLRVLFGDPIREIRLDWAIAGEPRTFRVPGVGIELPANARLTLLAGAGEADLLHVAFGITLDASCSGVRAFSDFALMRGEERETHGDEAAEKPLLELSAQPNKLVTLILLDWKITELKLPKFFQQCTAPIAAFDFGDPEALAQATPYTTESLSSDDWTVHLTFSPTTLPFLKGGGGAEQQFIQIDPSRTLADVRIENKAFVIRVEIGILVAIGDLELATAIPVELNLETFAFKVDHEIGLDLLGDSEVIEPSSDHLGLHWKFQGVPAKNSTGKFHFLTLSTKNNNYSLQQAPGAVFSVEYSQLSEEGIGFSISNFALTPKGISLTATVIDRPAKLNGIDTRFRFSDTSLTIVENRITDFTLKGSGPLPPALVGEATADIALQLAQRDGKLTLVSGGAQLKGLKKLHCEKTRFEFSITAIGVKFVYERKFHLYFTLTGSARFKLASGDDADGALALLPNIKIDLVECPLAGDARAIAKHVQFLIELPRPLSFNFLGAFEMELRGIGFVPQAEVFDGDGAMLVTGQLKFAQGAGDAADSRTDLHKLYIGLPKPGGIFPRLHFANLPVHLNFGSAFRLNGTVDFLDGALEKGFSGEGTLAIEGLPTIAASFAFLRVRRDETAPWVRAWFVYIEARKVSFQIPVVQIYLREVGLGFGYRYTIVSLKAADQAGDVGKLITELTKLSRTQGDLSKRDRWAVDLEAAGEDARWTVALRAMMSQTSAATSPLQYDENKERNLPCLFLLDAVIALRSDLTFLMSARGWLFANYYDYVTDYKGLREKPVVSGFVLLSPRQKRLLAHVASNPGGQLGPHPPMPPFVQKALSKSQFSATLLIEPGLLHTELGWPNQLRWGDKYGPLEVELRGGFIFRISSDELVTGVSYLARARLDVKAEVSLGAVGVRVRAEANVAYGGRYIGLLSLKDPLGSSAMYGGIGIEAMIRFAVEFWLKIKLWRIKITKTWRFSFTLDFTAGLEFGLVGVSTSGIGLRGSGNLAVSVMGRRFSISAKFGANEGAVREALARTEHVLKLGLEATEVEAIPGTSGTGSPAAPAMDAPLRAPAALSVARAMAMDAAPPFQAPDYSVFAVRGATAADASYFVLMPAGERADGSEEQGFLPVPPQDAVTADFELRIPAAGNYTLEQWDPIQGAWVVRAADAAGARTVRWAAKWDTPIATGEQHALDADGEPTGEIPAERAFRLREYLRNAFVVTETPGALPDDEPIITPVSDPSVLPGATPVEDERVQNPTDAAFEAAVRGAMEQFRGSPYFRRDPNSEYERLLGLAYSDDTTIYNQSGTIDGGTDLDALRTEQQAHELRGLVIHDLVSDLRDYAAAAKGAASDPPVPADSIAFAMGLVFRVRGGMPPWLEAPAASPALAPTISQRLAPGEAAPASTAPRTAVRTFNVKATDFAANPPRFERVQQLTDASTIALAWDLVWPEPPAGLVTPAQRDPDHHLVHYLVRRRALDGNDREAVYTVKGADSLHRELDSTGASVLKRLRRRFQLVDHFAEETVEDLALLPARGKSYLYSITPVDFAGNAGRPLSLVATRYPSDPPAVPVDGECTVHYRVDEATLQPASAAPPAGAPPLLAPAAFTVRWTEATAPQRGPAIPIDTYRLVFRRESTLPIGSYGLDGTTQRPAAKSLPTSNARPLPTDVKVALIPEGPADARQAQVALEDLQAAGVLPAGAEPEWRPEAWRVFFQTVSLNEVPSALAPVKVLLRVEANTETFAPLGPPSSRREERRPGELEWLPRPLQLPLLPPEDELATVGAAHVPMPRLGADAGTLRFSAALDNVVHRSHPGGVRCVRFRWNQGPSAAAAYPLDLSAGYQLLELDTDAHTTDTFESDERLAEALRPIQEVQMIPADELALTPGDTLAPSQWEAWYPSTVLRRRDPGQRAEGSQLPLAPWYSWRESIPEWPRWAVVGDGEPQAVRDAAHHPRLGAVVAALSKSFRVELQAAPGMQPQGLAGFLKATSPSSDPYGWGILQRFGLSVAFRLRATDTGGFVTGAALLTAVNDAIEAAFPAADPADPEGAELRRHLHVELLFQPGRAIELVDGVAATPDALVALAQLSLRPVVRQTRRYGRIALEGTPGKPVDVVLSVAPGRSCSLVDEGDAASGQIELEASTDALVVPRTVRFPLGGRTALLFRAAQLPRVGVPVPGTLDPAELAPLAALFEYVATPAPHVLWREGAPAPTPAQRTALAGALGEAAASLLLSLAVRPFAVTEEQAALFTASPGVIARDLADDASDAGRSWRLFRMYAESCSSTDGGVPDELKIRVPLTKDEIEPLVPDYAAWTRRFLEHGGATAPTGADPGLDAGMVGPWVATAYPRAGSPAFAAPDASGRLTYDHLLEDPWAHAYRYFVRPYARYDLLWQGLRQSPALFPGTPRLADASPNHEAGGLDVVLDRTRAVAKPVVLSSARLDPPGSIAAPAAPGMTWEVIVAEHPEQTLSGHNQTLARQLAFRQISYTLLRQFAYPRWLEQLGLAIELAPERYPDPPAALPAAPEHLDLSAPLADADARTLDLPRRIGPFQQGALALQWEGLPFYYEHRLLLVAQSARTVSPVNEITHRDFEYRTPDPISEIEPVLADWVAVPPFGAGASGALHGIRARAVSLTLRRLWDSLPAEAQARWPTEAPDGTRRTPGWVPDLGVVYQLVESFSGNVEVQAEVYFDEQAGAFATRQLGRRFLADLGPGALKAPESGGTFSLGLVVQQVTEQELSREYGASDLDRIDATTRPKVAFAGTRLSFAGVLSHDDLAHLLAAIEPADAQAVRSIHDAWYSQVPVSAPPASIPAAFAEVLDLPEPRETPVVWDGAMSPEEKAALLALPGDPELRAALARLASAVGDGTGVVSVSAPLGPEQIPPLLRARASLALDAATGAYTEVRWSGNLSDADAGALTAWPQVRALSAAVATLIATADGTSHTVPLAPARPLAAELQPELAGRLLIDDTQLGWTKPAPTDAQRAALASLAGDAAFVASRAALLAAIDAARAVALGPLVERPTAATLPTALSQLVIAPPVLSWTAPAPTDAQRAALLALTGDRAFLAAMRALLEAIASGAGTEVPLTPFVPRPAPGDLPAALQGRLLIGTDKLEWTSPAPTDAERAALDVLTGDDAFVDALALLRAAIDSDRSVPMDPVVARPRQGDIPDWLGGQLEIASDALTWIGRLHDATWRAGLEGLPGDPPFVAAVQLLLQQVDAQVVAAPFTVAARPAAEALGALEGKLVIGRVLLRFHGLMARTEVAELQALFAREPDRRAIARLYAATGSSGMRGRELGVRTRRGTAAPSALHPIPPKPLP